MNGSWLMVQGSWLMAKGADAGPGGAPRPKVAKFPSFKMFNSDKSKDVGHTCPTFPTLQNPKLPQNNTFENELGFVLGLFGVSWCLQRKIILVLELRDTSKSPDIMKMRGLRVLI